MTKEHIGVVLECEGIGDCLYAMPILRKLHQLYKDTHVHDVFTHHPDLFKHCPYVGTVYSIKDKWQGHFYSSKNRMLPLFDPKKLPHHLMDTCDFMSIPMTIGQLSFREKQLEYFPSEPDSAQAFDVVINTSQTWPSRSWPLENWQRLADALLARGLSVAVVGKSVRSADDNMTKVSSPLAGCADLVDKLSLDQTFFTISKCRLFVTNQNGLSVLSGATDAEVIVLDQSIEWSKRAIYRKEDPHYKVTYVKGDCQIYCCSGKACPVPENEGVFRCIPSYERVHAAVARKLGLPL